MRRKAKKKWGDERGDGKKRETRRKMKKKWGDETSDEKQNWETRWETGKKWGDGTQDEKKWEMRCVTKKGGDET